MSATPIDPASERVPVLMYHRVGEPGGDGDHKYCVPAATFRAQMQELSARGYEAISIDQLLRWLGGIGSIPERTFVLTFDDGFRDIREHAMPVLQELGWPCTVFVVTGLIGSNDAWNEQPGRERHRLLGHGEMLELAGRGVQFESHTRSHRRLTQLAPEELALELMASRSDLESLLARPVKYLAYPFGELDDRVVEAAHLAGYAAGFSAQPGFNRRNVDRFRIRRLDVFGTDTPGQLLRKVQLGANDGSLHAMVRYYGRRTVRRVWQ